MSQEIENRYRTALSAWYRYYVAGDREFLPRTPSGKYMPKMMRVEGCHCYRWWHRIYVSHQLNDDHLRHKYKLDDQIWRLVCWQNRREHSVEVLVTLAMSLHFGKQLGIDPDTVDLKEYYQDETR